MAFTNASGYNNLSQGNFTPQIFSQKVQKFFRRASVVEDITNTDYAGEIENFGDTVKIIKEPTITVRDYARGQTVGIIFLWLSAFLTLFTGYDYMRKGIDHAISEDNKD